MPLRIGDSAVDKVYVGTDPVDKIYIGTELVWTGLAPDWVVYSPNIVVGQQYAPPSGGWASITVAAICVPGMPAGNIIRPLNQDLRLTMVQESGQPQALTGNGSSWSHANPRPGRARDAMIITRTATSQWSRVNDSTLTTNVALPAITVPMNVQQAPTQLRALAIWNRALTPAEQIEALVQLNAAAP